MCNSAFISLGTELPLPVFETGRNGTKPKNVHFIHLRFSKTEFRFLMMKFELICINSNLQPFSTCAYVVFFSFWAARFQHTVVSVCTSDLLFEHTLFSYQCWWRTLDIAFEIWWNVKSGKMKQKIEIKAISQSKPPEKTVVERTMDDFAFGVGANVRCEYKSR